jgi:hypothetical protein
MANDPLLLRHNQEAPRYSGALLTFLVEMIRSPFHPLRYLSWAAGPEDLTPHSPHHDHPYMNRLMNRRDLNVKLSYETTNAIYPGMLREMEPVGLQLAAPIGSRVSQSLKLMYCSGNVIFISLIDSIVS